MSLLVGWNIELANDAIPDRVGFLSARLGRRNRSHQRPAREEVCERVVAHLTLTLRDRIDVLQVVAMACRVVAHTACPESGYITNNRPAVLPKPLAIVSGKIVLPLGHRDCRIHVDLALSQRECRVRGLLGAIFRICFPRIHRTGEPMFTGPLLSRRQSALSKGHE